jgi:hypothetical protein
MGKIEKEGEEVVYKQDNGEITAWLTDLEEKMELGHGGTQKYKNIFYAAVLISFIYLGVVLWLF